MEAVPKVLEAVRRLRSIPSSQASPEIVIEAARDLSENQLRNFVEAKSRSAAPDLVDTLKAVFEAASLDVSTLGMLRICAVVKTVELIVMGALKGKQSSEVAELICQELATLNEETVIVISRIIMSAFRQDSKADPTICDLIPRILSSVEVFQTVHVPSDELAGSSEEVRGVDYKNRVVDFFCRCEWPRHLTVSFVTVLKDLEITENQMTWMIRKALKHLIELDFEELPPLIYQLLLLSCKGCRDLILAGIFSFFSFAEETSINRMGDGSDDGGRKLIPEKLLRVCGTATLHFNFAAKQDQALAKAIIRLAREGSLKMSSFGISCLLSLSRIHRLEEQIFKFIQGAVLCRNRKAVWRSQSQFIREIENIASQQDIGGIVVRVAQSSMCGWDDVAVSLLQLGVALLDLPPLKGPLAPSHPTQPYYIGKTILCEVFRIHENARLEVLQQIFCRILSNSESAPRYISVLEVVAKDRPQLLMEHISKIKEALDYVAHMRNGAATGLLKALKPVFKMKQDLQNYLVLILRKAVFSREADASFNAVSGFLQLLGSAKSPAWLGSSRSQSQAVFSQAVTCSQPLFGRYQANTEQSYIYIEILGFLKRSLTQCCSVREHLYQGLFDILRTNPQLQEPIFELVMPQFMKYYVEDTSSTPPLQLRLCVGTAGDVAIITEPLPHLILCITRCLALCPEEIAENLEDDMLIVDGSRDVKKIRECMASLLHRTLKTSLDDFGVGESATEKSSASLRAKLLAGVLEALIEYVVMSPRWDAATFRNLGKLFDMHQNLKQSWKDKTAVSASKPGPNGAAKKSKKASQTEASGSQKTAIISREGASKSSLVSGSSTNGVVISASCVLQLLRFLAGEAGPDGTIRGSQALLLRLNAGDGSQGNSATQSPVELRNNSAFQRFILERALKTFEKIRLGLSSDVETVGRSTETSHACKLAIQAAPLILRIFDDLKGFHRVKEEALNKQAKKTGKGSSAAPPFAKPVTVIALECLDACVQIVASNMAPVKVASFLSSLLRSVFPQETYPPVPQQNTTEDTVTLGSIFTDLTMKFQKNVFNPLLLAGANREAEVALGTLQSLVTRYVDEGGMKEHYQWIQANDGFDCQDGRFVKALVTFSIRIRKPPLDLLHVLSLGQDVLTVLGKVQIGEQEATSQADAERSYINKSTVADVGRVLLSCLEEALEHLDWLFQIFSKTSNQELEDKLPPEIRGTEAESANKRQWATSMEQRWYERVSSVLNVLAVLVPSELSSKLLDSLLGILTKLYRSQGAMIKFVISKNDGICLSFKKITRQCCEQVTPLVYAQLQSRGGDLDEASGTGRESQTVPNLIYAIEFYETLVIKLSKKFKVDLTRYLKRSTSRDFRIKQELLESLNAGADSENEGDSEDGDGKAQTQTPRKRKGRPEARAALSDAENNSSLANLANRGSSGPEEGEDQPLTRKKGKKR